MNKRISIADKQPEAKSQNLATQIRRKTESYQSMSSPVDRILFLQRTIGNQAVTRLIKSGTLQAKLRIGQPGDIYEQEADRVAEQVMATSAHPSASSSPPRIQRLAGPSVGQGDAAPASVDHALASPGMPLVPTLRQDMEQRFGYDFSGVRVHSGAAAGQSAREVNSNAYTVGYNIVFGAGEYAPDTERGRQVLAHELTHVVQQSYLDGNRIGQSNKSRNLSPISQQGDAGHIQRYGPFVPCEQASLSLQPCPPREEDEVAQSRTESMTLHGEKWLSENGYSVNGYLLVGFEVGRSAIKKGIKDLLEWKQLVALMKESNIQWKIQGISDCSGSKDLNDRIRRARAEAVYNFLPEDARKHVVSRESVPLYDCITGNQRKVDRTVNRSVLIEQVGRAVDIKPSEEEPIEGKPPKFVCGPDVTTQVSDALNYTRALFGGWSRPDRYVACNALVEPPEAAFAWDILDLHKNAWILQYRCSPPSDSCPVDETCPPKPKQVCATCGGKPSCGSTVQVGNECYYAGSANYAIFGTMCKLCWEEFKESKFSGDSMRSLVWLYKLGGLKGANVDTAKAWATAGYRGWPSGGTPPRGDRPNCSPMCPTPYQGTAFRITWCPHENPYSECLSVSAAIESIVEHVF